MKFFLMEFIIFFVWPLALPNPNFKCRHLKISMKTCKEGLDIFLDFSSRPFKFSGHVHFNHLESHEKIHGRISTDRDATPRV